MSEQVFRKKWRPYQIHSKEMETPQKHIDENNTMIEIFKDLVDEIDKEIDELVALELEFGIQNPDLLRVKASYRSYYQYMIGALKTSNKRCESYLERSDQDCISL